MKKLIEKLERELVTIREDKIEEQAIEMLDWEDYRDEESMQEAVGEKITEIYEDAERQWECWYARGYEVAMKDIILRLKK